MTFERRVPGDLDYEFFRLGSSRMRFRGPKPDIERPFVAFLGGAETFGQFVPNPYSNLIEDELNVPCLNLGATHAGLDLYLNDPSVLRVIELAQLTVIQVVGAQNMSNRFYRVHPRRNDRFLRASDSLKRLYQEIDFTEFNFTNHMLLTLEKTCPKRFALLREELSQAWTARMAHLIGLIPSGAVLFWLAPYAPLHQETSVRRVGPMFITKDMVQRLRQHCLDYVETEVSQDNLNLGTEGMVFPPDKEPLAQRCSGPAVHHQAAQALMPVIRSHMQLAAS